MRPTSPSCATACAPISAANFSPGSAALLAWADTLAELKTICCCGRKATMVVRVSPSGDVERAGQQIEVGGNERYVSLCRKHFSESHRTGVCPGSIS